MEGYEGCHGDLAELVADVAEVGGGPPEEETDALGRPPLHLRGEEEGD